MRINYQKKIVSAKICTFDQRIFLTTISFLKQIFSKKIVLAQNCIFDEMDFFD